MEGSRDACRSRVTRVVTRVTVTEAEVDFAIGAEDGDHLLLFAALDVTAVRVDATSLGASARVLALVVNVIRDTSIGSLIPRHRHRLQAEWADGHLVVFEVRLFTRVAGVAVVILAKDAGAGITAHRQEVCAFGEE